MKCHRRSLSLLLGTCLPVLCLISPRISSAQSKGFNYTESKVPKYDLPDPLICLDGTKVTDAKTWTEKRRPEILRLFEEHVYGKSPRISGKSRTGVKPVERKRPIFNGLGTRSQYSIEIRTPGVPGSILKYDLLIYLPAKAKKNVPTFLMLNFRGNHTIQSDPALRITKTWVRNDPKNGVTNNKASEKSCGVAKSRWAIEKILKAGYGLATIYYGDIVPDHKDGLKSGPHQFYLKKGQAEPAADEWGAVAGWAWGLSRALDFFESEAFMARRLNRADIGVDPKRVIVIGHSRLGKTALWAGAADPRFAMVISNDSGCGGAALSRRAFGETVKRINTSFPHWFCGNFKKYNGRENQIPVDQHMLIALMAPRPVYVASAQGDQWADPRGEFLSCLHASPVYKLLGTTGLPAKTMPAVNKPVQGQIGYHMRTGKHDVTDYDWQQYLRFADTHLKKKTSRK